MKILVVDDAEFMREVVTGILNDAGYTDVIEADDGDKALKLYRENDIDLTILDITMPNVDGIEALMRIKAIKPDAKVIMCSAIGQQQQILRSLKLGAADYIVKPFKPEYILKTIKKVMGAER